MQEIKVAAVQTAPKIGDVAANLTEIKRELAAAAAQGVRLAVFTECVLTGYNYASRAAALPHAETLPGAASRELTAACRDHDIFTVFGLLEKDGDRLYNSAVLAGPEGIIGVYRKTHRPLLGVDRFVDAGTGPLEVYDTPLGRIGILICYDVAFPECPRVLALKGADIIALPSNFPEGKALRVIEHIFPARTIENRVYLVAANRGGEEHGTVYAGRSRILDTTGEIMAAAGATETGLVTATITPEAARQKRIVVRPGEYETDYVGDRRPELYGDLTG